MPWWQGPTNTRNQLQLANINIGNYNLGASYCRKYSFKSGMCIFVNKYLNSTPLNLNVYFSDYDIGMCEVKLHCVLSHIRLHVFTIYRAPLTRSVLTIDVISKFLNSSKTEFTFCGNISTNYLIDTHTYLLTYNLLTPWCRVLLEKLPGLQLVKKFAVFHGTRRFITALTSVRHLSLS